MTDSPVDPERLAALLEGRVGEREREELLARLGASDEDLEVFANALAVTRDLEAADAAQGVIALRPAHAPEPGDATHGTAPPPPARAPEPSDEAPGVIPLRPRRSAAPVRWAGMAAAVAALALLPLAWRLGRAPGLASPSAVVAMLNDESAGLPPGWEARPWSVTRGTGDGLSEQARAFRVGALLTDLDLAARAGDPATQAIAREVAALLDAVPASGPAASGYREIAGAADAAPGALSEQVRESGESVRGLLDDEVMAVGAWAEGARIAAARRDAAFFHARRSRAMLDRAERAASDNDEAAAAITQIRRALGTQGAPDWAVIDAAIQRFMRASG